MKGEIVFLYAFDVANEILTAKIGAILTREPFPFKVRPERAFPRDVPFYRPLVIDPPPLVDTMDGAPLRVLVRVYDVGVVAIAVRLAFDNKSLLDLHRFHEPRVDSGQALDQVARDLCRQVCRSFESALVTGVPPSEPEAYTAFCLSDVDGATDASEWLARERRAVAGLLSATPPERLSEAQVAEVLRLQRSYEKTDLVVIDWDAALVIDSCAHSEDVLYVLELANLQLEEFRIMDERIDQALNRVYEGLSRRRFRPLGASQPALRSMRQFRLDAARLADEVTHITKFVGDWYLARVYLGARDRFHLDQWRRSIEERLTQLDQLYTVVHSEIYERRMLWLEIVIVILFVIDVVGLFLWKR